MSQRKPGSFQRQLNQPLEAVRTIDEEADAIREREASQQKACADAIGEILRGPPMFELSEAMLSNPVVRSRLPLRRPPMAQGETYDAALEAHLQRLRACVPPRLAEVIERARQNKKASRETPLADEILVMYCCLEFAGVHATEISRKIELRLRCDRIHIRKVLRSYGISLKALRQQKGEC